MIKGDRTGRVCYIGPLKHLKPSMVFVGVQLESTGTYNVLFYSPGAQLGGMVKGDFCPIEYALEAAKGHGTV